MTLQPFRLVIFDCDGVLVDSEPLSQGLLRQEAAAYGCAITDTELHSTTGLTWSALKPVFEHRLARPLPADWASIMQERLISILAENVEAMPHAREALLEARRLGLPYRIASNSSHEEMREKFTRTGLWDLVKGLTHSARDVARGKPAPDLFLAAAAACGVRPGECLVVEDSAPGLMAACAAGMQAIEYAPSGARSGIVAAARIASLAQLPATFSQNAALAELVR